MIDLNEKFRVLDEVPFTRTPPRIPAAASEGSGPDWGGPRPRSATDHLEGSTGRRLFAAVVAFAIFAAASVFAWSALRGGRPQAQGSGTPIPTPTATRAVPLRVRSVDQFNL